MNFIRREKQWFIYAMEKVYSTDADRSDRVAVISFGQRNELCFVSEPAALLLPVLKCDLERDFDGGRTVIRVKDTGKSPGDDVNKFFSEEYCGYV